MSNTENPMEIAAEEPPRGVKRQNMVLVDPDDKKEISSAKKARIEPDLGKKVKCLNFIIGAFKRIHDAHFSTVDADYKNITLGNQITNIVFACFNIKRQAANGILGNAGKKAAERKSFNVTSKGKSYTVLYPAAIKAIEDSAAEQGLPFKKFGPTDADNWYGTAAPYLDFFAGNSLRITELRIGHSNMPIKKEGDKHTAFPVSKYGLNGSHHILLEGCTFPPEKRGSMAQSLGPMTTLLCHITTEEKYRKKWTDAAKRAMSHVPIIDEILSVVRGKPAAEVRGLITLLADILLITTSRQAQRMFFPLNTIVWLHQRPVGADGFILGADGKSTGLVGGDKMLEGFNVSGNGGFYVYNMISHQAWEFEGDWEPSMAAQAVFHSIFGTYKEDLSILEAITNIGNWNTREEMGRSFQKMTSGKSVVTRLPSLRLYSKLASANMTGLLASSYVQVCASPVFSGARRQHFTDDFFEQIGKSSGAISTAKTIPQLTATLSTLLTDLRKKMIEGGKFLDMGTVTWKEINGMDIKAGGAETNEVIQGVGKFFLGRRTK